MGEYTLVAAVAVVLVVALELVVLRTGIFATAQFWLSMVIVLGFQVLVDGWLTKLSDPIVLYDDAETLGVRWPWDIPVEDFAFGFAMVTLAILLWRSLPGYRTTGRGSRRARTTTRTTEESPR